MRVVVLMVEMPTEDEMKYDEAITEVAIKDATSTWVAKVRTLDVEYISVA